MLKYFEKLKKRTTNTKLLSTEFCVLDKDGNLKGNFQTLKEAKIMLESNPDYKGYKFQTYTIETTTNI